MMSNRLVLQPEIKCAPMMLSLNNIHRIPLLIFSLMTHCPRRHCAMRMVTMKPSCLRAAERAAGGPVSAAPMKGGAWRDDAAGDIRSRTAEATRLPQHHQAAHIRAASCPSVDVVLKTSAKGEERGGRRGMEKWKMSKRRKKNYPCFHFILNLVQSCI